MPEELAVGDWRTLVVNPDLEVIVEMIGGTTDAFELISQALQNGKHVITANKALLAERGAELFQTALKHQRHLLFEASVGGGIPIIRALREGLAGNRILAIHGIINGTCNYILSRMEEADLEFADALAEAKLKGYAEADDSLDVDGHDTAHKAAVLAALAYGFWVAPGELYTEGLRRRGEAGPAVRAQARLPAEAAGDHQGRSRRRGGGARASDAGPADQPAWRRCMAFSMRCWCAAMWWAIRFPTGAARAAIRRRAR